MSNFNDKKFTPPVRMLYGIQPDTREDAFEFVESKSKKESEDINERLLSSLNRIEILLEKILKKI